MAELKRIIGSFGLSFTPGYKSVSDPIDGTQWTDFDLVARFRPGFIISLLYIVAFEQRFFQMTK